MNPETAKRIATLYFPLLLLTCALSLIEFWIIGQLFPKWMTQQMIEVLEFEKQIFETLPARNLYLVVIGPFIEEILFRGILFTLLNKVMGTWPTVVVTSVLFGVGHTLPIGAILFGILMCLAMLEFKNLWVPIFLHVLNNGYALLIEYLFGTPQEHLPGIGTLIEALLLTSLALVILIKSVDFHKSRSRVFRSATG